MIGGYEKSSVQAMSGAPTTSCEMINIAKGTIETAASMNIPRSEFVALQTKDSNIVVISGITNQGSQGKGPLTASCEIFERNTRTWRTLGNLLVGRRQHVAEFISDNEILVVGGRYQNLVSMHDAEIFNITTGKSRKVKNFPNAINSAVAGITSDNRLVVFGGRDGGPNSRRTDTIYAYNAATNIWEKHSLLPEEQCASHVLKLWNGKLLISGGTLSEAPFNFIRRVSLLDGPSISTLGNMQDERIWNQNAQWNKDSAISIGGYDNADAVLKTTDWINFTSPRVTAGPSMKFARKNFSSASIPLKDKSGNVLQSRILAISGMSANNTNLESVEILQSDFIAPPTPCAKISGIINIYSAVTQISNSKTFVTVSDATGFKKDDQVLFIQMQGADIDTTNTVNYGTVKNNNGAGSYEFAVIAGINGNTITFTQPLANQEYNVNGKIQLVSMPSFSKVIVRDELTCAPWNGTTGGILALSANCLSLEGQINVSGKGFRGGSYQVNTFNPETSDSVYATSLPYFGHKGEGIAGFGAGDKISGRGAPANGGGGGNSHNGGGGGGSNAGKGGNGGFGYALKPNANKAGGIGGSFTSFAVPKIYLGGGGGAGQINDGHGSAGGNGGGIIIINAGTIENKSVFTVLANGVSADDDTDPANPDGCGGGGAGGTILINGKIDGDLLPVLSVGGDGGSRFNSAIGHGTGGGGGGGLLISTSDDILNLGISNVAAGKAGSALEGGTYGAADGTSGTRLKITTSVLPGLLKAPDTALCQGCYPTIQTAQQLCSPATFSASDENYLLKTLELDNTQSSNISMKLSGSLPAAQMTGTLSLIDPTKPGTFVIRAVNVNDNTASYTSQVYPVPSPTASVAGENLSSANTQPNDALQWYYNGTIITGANGKTYKVTKSGEYYIEATNIYGCKGVSEKATITLTDIGDDAVKDDFFALYPNPATEQLFIESRQHLNGTIMLEITNFLGESTFKSTYQAAGNSFKTSVPLENLPSGTYFVHITSGSFKKVYKIVRK